MSDSKTVYLATRGSALALAQSNLVLAQCRALFPGRAFELKIIKTTGDKLQTANLANPDQQLPKGLFTKELELSMLNGETSLAVHSLKDLPTELPEGLGLAGVSVREDVRDVLIYRSKTGGKRVAEFAAGATIATSSTRRQAQLLALRPGLRTVPIRGNVGTRLNKLAERADLDGIVLAMAGLKRLGYAIEDGRLAGGNVPEGLAVTVLPVEEMLPCVGQAALGYECRKGDALAEEICAALNHSPTLQAVTAERAFLQAMGGGCLSPVGAFGEVSGGELRLRAVSFQNAQVKRAEKSSAPEQAGILGRAVAEALR